MALALLVLLAAPPFTHSVEPVTRAQLGSWHQGCPVGPSALRLLRVGYWGFDGRPALGTLVVNRRAVGRARRLRPALRARASRSGGSSRSTPTAASDERSMAADNTSAFNCRYAVGARARNAGQCTPTARAIDVNPVENPYLAGGRVSPRAGKAYLDRTNVRPGMAVRGGRSCAPSRGRLGVGRALDRHARLPALLVERTLGLHDVVADVRHERRLDDLRQRQPRCAAPSSPKRLTPPPSSTGATWRCNSSSKPGAQVLLRDVRAAADRDVLVAGRRPRLLERGLDAVGDEVNVVPPSFVSGSRA